MLNSLKSPATQGSLLSGSPYLIKTLGTEAHETLVVFLQDSLRIQHGGKIMLQTLSHCESGHDSLLGLLQSGNSC